MRTALKMTSCCTSTARTACSKPLTCVPRPGLQSLGSHRTHLGLGGALSVPSEAGRGWRTPLNTGSNPRAHRTVACAVTVGKSGDDGRNEILETLMLGLMFGGWYLSNIAFNVFNKQVLKVFPMPVTCTTVQFLVGAVLALMFWATGIVPKPKLTRDVVMRVLPLAMAHTLGNLLTNVSLGAVAVSFTHTIKAMEPAFSVMLSALFLGDMPHPLVLLTLVPIMGGVAMASLSEATFNWVGFLSAMGSNLTFQSRNVLSKKLMIKKSGPGGDSLDNINLFAIITIWSCVLLLPFSLLLEGWQLTPSALSAMGVQNSGDVILKAIAAGVCFHTYQQVSYMILARVSPVTHSIGNCIKRVVVIVASVLFFRNSMSLQSMLGTSVALVGVTAYSMVKRMTMAAKQKAG